MNQCMLLLIKKMKKHLPTPWPHRRPQGIAPHTSGNRWPPSLPTCGNSATTSTNRNCVSIQILLKHRRIERDTSADVYSWIEARCGTSIDPLQRVSGTGKRKRRVAEEFRVSWMPWARPCMPTHPLYFDSRNSSETNPPDARYKPLYYTKRAI